MQQQVMQRLLLLLLHLGFLTAAAVTDGGDAGDELDGETGGLRNHLGEKVPVIGENEQHLAMAPRLVKEPLAVYYATHKTPAVIECIADHSSYVTIHCNGKVLNRKVEVLSDHERAERQRFSVSIEFADVQQWSGQEFYCNCEAWNHVPELNNTLRKVVSRRGLVRLSFFDSDRFQFDPVPLNVSREANNVVLSCTPPTGTPKPQVKWLKDGVPLEVSGMGDRVTIDHQKQLIIRPLTLDDRGNYSCVAEIPGQQVHSKPAQLWIYVDGAWSTWSLWEACDVRCETPRSDCPGVCFSKSRERHRLCDSPQPQFGGRPCPGEARQREPCDIKCTVHGSWSEWSSWSYCGPDCQSARHRTCNNPAPRNGGHPCPAGPGYGPDLGGSQSMNCTEGLCKKEDITLLRYINGNGKAVNSDHVPSLNNVAIYIGLFVAAAVIVTVAMVIIFLVRRKTVSFASGRRSLRCDMHTNGNCSTISSNDKDGKHTNELLLPPDLSSSGTTIKNPNVIEMSQQQHKQQQQQQQSLSEQGLRVHLPMSSTYQSISHQQQLQQLQQQQQQQFPYSTCYASSPLDFNTRPCSALYHELGLDSRVSASFVPAGLCPDQLVWANVGPSGGRLSLVESGTSLTLPPGCLTGSEDIFLSVSRDTAECPPLTDRQTLLSPVVACGPSGVSLSRHAVLSMPHSACLRQGFWNSVVLCRWDGAGDNGWRELLRVGHEATQQLQHQQQHQQQQHQAAFCQLDQSVCHLLVPSLGRYCLIGQSLEGGSAAKQLRLAAFAAPLISSPDFSLRIHVLPDTPDALHQVMVTELQSGARLLDTPKQLMFKDCGDQLCFSIEELSMGWRSKSKHQEIPFAHVWTGATAGLHCAFSLEHVDPTRQSVSCKIVAYQNHNYNLRQVVHIVSSKSDLPCVSPASSQPPQPLLPPPPPPLCPTKSMMLDPGLMLPPGGTHRDQQPQSILKLPPRVRMALCHLLDAPHAHGSDWRMLSRKMGIERCVSYFACQPSPTECLLDLWEARCREEDSVAKLSAILTAMNRHDAASLLQQDSAHWL